MENVKMEKDGSDIYLKNEKNDSHSDYVPSVEDISPTTIEGPAFFSEENSLMEDLKTKNMKQPHPKPVASQSEISIKEEVLYFEEDMETNRKMCMKEEKNIAEYDSLQTYEDDSTKLNIEQDEAKDDIQSMEIPGSHNGEASRGKSTTDQEDTYNVGEVSGNGNSEGGVDSNLNSKRLNKSSLKCKTPSKLKNQTKKYFCDQCNKLFRSHKFLVSHRCSLTDPKPYKCTVCSKGFSKSCYLRVHIQIHSEEKPYQCNICGKNFSCHNYLFRHSAIHKTKKPYFCDICGKSFYDPTYFQTHRRIHRGERIYNCDTCGKTFIHGSHLRRHVRQHKKEGNFECPVCGKTFIDGSILRAHTRVHSGEKPYPCTICDKRFTQTGSLQRHMRSHTGEKRYKCQLCDKAFYDRCKLQRHMSVHGKEKASDVDSMEN